MMVDKINVCPFCETPDLRFYVCDNDGWHKEAHLICDDCEVDMTEWVAWEKFYDSELPDKGQLLFESECRDRLYKKWNCYNIIHC